MHRLDLRTVPTLRAAVSIARWGETDNPTWISIGGPVIGAGARSDHAALTPMPACNTILALKHERLRSPAFENGARRGVASRPDPPSIPRNPDTQSSSLTKLRAGQRAPSKSNITWCERIVTVAMTRVGMNLLIYARNHARFVSCCFPEKTSRKLAWWCLPAAMLTNMIITRRLTDRSVRELQRFSSSGRVRF